MILGLDTGTRTVAEAEHLLHTVARALGLAGDTIGCTHLIPGGHGMDEPHVACSLAVPDPPTSLPPGVSWALSSGAPGSETPGSGALSSGLLSSAPLSGDRGGPFAAGAALAAAAHFDRRAGRVVTYPGRDQLTGVVTVAALLAGSAIERVLLLASADPPGGDVLVLTNDHVRPVWQDGLMTLLTMPAAGGRIAPAEVPCPTPCCADHP
ncbi:hypothetical protein [Nonomuraea zeae]|uniref:Uncharacterized protein n=1 Tax=Nonomuraea zeae TaxID=1642303 RepID=A0A5S4G2R2_9ACTN|nr:hypothetical protein [Nonomuraea zeae]TMR26691.1 hypothetical protein ETD85_41745 [Nonomuraea zeae]